MENLTTQEIERVFAMYYGCEILTNGTNTNVLTDGIITTAAACNWKLLLTPLSAITDEHAIKLAEIEFNRKTKPGQEDTALFYGKSAMEGIRMPNCSVQNGYRVYQQLILWGYAVPLYFGINHPCNGKTAIELGIAIDKSQINEQKK